jgi:steroid delta-isomerase-like uncharacterized protein
MSTDTMPAEATSTDLTRAIGPLFFKEQDRLRGGPAEAICAPTYTAYIGGNPPSDLAGHQYFATAFYQAFPDLSHTIEDTVAEPGKVAVRFVLRGTNTGDFMGIPATGKQIHVTAQAILRVVDGKVTELHSNFDQFGMLTQLGVIPG